MFDDGKADRAVRFFNEVLRHCEGEWAGQKFALQPWQEHRIVRPLFGTLREDGTRQYRTCYVEVPRKNGKSALASGIALYLLCLDGEPGAQIFSAAADREQASIVFRVAAQMVGQSAELQKRLRVLNSTKRIVFDKPAGFYRVLSADAPSKHGFNAHGVIFDELHSQPNRELYDVLNSSMGARRQPLMFIITTAGFDRHSICWELHEYAEKVSSGVIDDPSFLPVLYKADDKADWKDPAVWAIANPSLDVTVKASYLEQECKRAQESPAYENTFRRLYLNQWTQQRDRWLSLDTWDACGDIGDLEDLAGRPCFAGLDLASTTDIAALVLVFPWENDTYDVLPFFFVPQESITQRARRDRVPYDVWARQGYITATEGNVIDYRAIKAKLDELAQTYNLRDIGYDRWGSTQIVQWLEEGGLKVVPIGQGFASMTAPTKELIKLVMSGKIRHGNNPVLRWMADNMVLATDPAGNVKPDKAKATERIDGMTALVMGLDRAMREGGNVSNYETEGLFLV